MATHPGILLHLHTLPGSTGHCSLPILPDPSLTPPALAPSQVQVCLGAPAGRDGLGLSTGWGQGVTAQSLGGEELQT